MFYISKSVVFMCDDCSKTEVFNISRPSLVRKYGWAISKDYKKCYCPVCAPKHRNVGRPPRRRW